MSPALAFTVTEIERILEPVSPDPFIASFEAMAMMRRCQPEGERLPDDLDREKSVGWPLCPPGGRIRHRSFPAGSTTRSLSSSAHERSKS
jgi:hypothetical protein